MRDSAVLCLTVGKLSFAIQMDLDFIVSFSDISENTSEIFTFLYMLVLRVSIRFSC